MRLYRFLFMIGGALFGIHGVLLVFIFFLINLASYDFLGMPYLMPFAPPNYANLKDSIIKFPIKNIRKRNQILSDNVIRNKSGEAYEE